MFLFLKMAPRELAEAGFPGVEDYLLPAEPDQGWEPESAASKCEMKVSDDHRTKMIPEVDPQAFHSGSDLLTELRRVHMLDEMIVEERQKIHLFREKERADEERSRSEIQDSSRLPGRKEREAFRLQLEKEKREVAKLEKSLDIECKAKKQKNKSRKVIRCSIMGKTRTEDQAPFLVRRDPEPEHETDVHEDLLDPHILTDNSSHHLDQLPASQADHFERETSVLSKNTPDGKAVQPLEGVFSEHPAKPEASLTPELRPDDGGFDPGGNSPVPPVPNPRNVLPAKDKPSEDEAPSSAEMQIPSLPPFPDLGSETALLPDELPERSDNNHNLDVKEHHHRSNNDHQTTAEEFNIGGFSETSVKDDDETSVEFEGLEEEDLQLVEEMRTLSPASQCLLPEFELSGREHEDEELTDGAQPSDWLKASACDSADGEVQLDVGVRKVIFNSH